MIKTLGYDPGGVNANGVACAIFGLDGVLLSKNSAVVRDPNRAIDWLIGHGANASAIGIDTMLKWSSAQRPCDYAIRKMYDLQSGSVQSLGSLKGSMIGYGLLVGRAVEAHLGVSLCEANPKPLRCARKLPKPLNDDHADDAFLAAYAAAQWKLGHWTTNLYEVFPIPNGWFPIGPAVYPWPDPEISSIKKVLKI